MSKLSKEDNIALADCIDLFKPINEATVLMFGNKTQRKSAWHLHKTYGVKVKDFVAFIPIYNARVKEFYQIQDPHTLLKNIKKFFEVKRKFDADERYEKEQREKERLDAEEAEKLKEIPLSEKKMKFDRIAEMLRNS